MSIHFTVGGRPPTSTQGYDVMEVCLSGHRITDAAASFPHRRKQFCPDCGERTIDACPECAAHIQGRPTGRIVPAGTPVPNHCPNCGAAYPWRQAAIANAIEVVQMHLDVADAASVPELVKLVSIQAPRTEVAALKLRRLVGTLKKPVYDTCINVLSDLMSATAKKTFGIK